MTLDSPCFAGGGTKGKRPLLGGAAGAEEGGDARHDGVACIQREAEQRQAGAVEAITSDPNVKALQKAFDATLHNETIRPRDS